MASTQEILDAASKLGQQIAEHEATSKLAAVLKNLEANTEAQRTLNDHNRYAQTLGEKEAAGKPIEVDEKRKLTSLHTAVIHHPLLRDMQMAQMDYADLMRRVDDAMTGRMAGADAPAAPAAARSPLIDPDGSGAKAS
jgi:cell fate (sporulation/competence/biofilm development) regulator YlbF (YheA/YmcA/DUF963 family)